MEADSERSTRMFLEASEAALAVAAQEAQGTSLPLLPVIRSSPFLEPILQVQSFYRAANALAVARGLDPDRPPYLAKVTETL